MSSSSNAQVISSYAAFVQGQYYSVAARALFLWDYFATLDREVEYIWGRTFSVASALFVLNRYVNLTITILELVEQAPFQTPQRYRDIQKPSNARVMIMLFISCPSVVRVLQSLLILATFIVGVFAALRVYATWSRDWRPALPILTLALVTPASNLYTDIIGTPIPAPRPSVGCAIQTNIDPDLYSKLVIIDRAATTTYDFLILLFTLIKTAEVRKAALSLDMNPSLMVLLLRDGTIYFLLLLVMNVAQIIVAAEVPGNNFIAFFISPLTSILITRFLLNLRQIAQTSERSPTESTEPARAPSILFSTGILGNLGAPLHSGFEVGDTLEDSYEEKLLYVDEPLLADLLQMNIGEIGREEVELGQLA